MAFLNSILKNSSNHKTPFEHWELNQPLTDGQGNVRDSKSKWNEM